VTRPPTTSVLIPCWNALELTRICLPRLMCSTSLPFELIVVDNGSTDGTGRWLRDWKRRMDRENGGRSVRILSNARNRGYAAAMNQAVGAARGRLVVFANADAAPARGWLEEMSAQFAARKRLGGLSPCANPPARRSARPWSVHGWYGNLDEMERFAAACAMRPSARPYRRATARVPGFWFMTTRDALRKSGLFDERFAGGGFEDWELQERLRRAGFELGHAGRAYVHHEWSGVSRRNGLPRSEFNRRNRELMKALHPSAYDWTLEVLSPLGVRV
jgi:GT2 family glycosyltransferase